MSQPQVKNLIHEKMVDLIEQIVNKGNQEFKKEIQGDLIKFKVDIFKKANEHVEKNIINLTKKME